MHYIQSSFNALSLHRSAMEIPFSPCASSFKSSQATDQELGPGSADENAESSLETSVELIPARESTLKRDGMKSVVYHRIHNAMCAALERGTIYYYNSDTVL